MHQAHENRFASVWGAIADTPQEAASLRARSALMMGMTEAMTTHRPHDKATVAILKSDPAFAATYLTVALDEADKPGGKAALLAALRNVATAHDLQLSTDASGSKPDEKSAA